ncbi:hypothetical protein N7468_006495 [Penicillium chermesinum]|uniref:FAD dependent oxidoreductase domain-containing protein n=1 Tax=Penicillium chermesinum TaxID=63820 RepID=A0A9W9NSC3_9EURO|nr:uncharacterized protein N7468_006495 [Penicillium chermesinum]KAJ5225270.1 hypothetical protein N7468_006495 [Penicillium chermesinum]KAJ6140579.1 hypothetical protein N7470_010375 [Penicillium chermesinum]
MPFATFLLGDTSIPVYERQQALDRIYSDPGVPNDSTTSSFWLKDPHPRFADQISQPLPQTADVVIIGSGITGASIARTLLQNRAKSNPPNPSHPAVAVLEARDICSGATGRNGGHILETADEYAELVDLHGEEAARKIIGFRLSHLAEMLSVAEEMGLTEETQARKVQFLSAYFGEQPWKDALERFQRFKEGMPEEAAEWTAYEGDAIPEEFKLSRADGVVAGPAGAVWPYKFVTGIFASLLSEYPDDFRINDHTSVESIAVDDASEYKFKVNTEYGSISARHVIHCTNAHVSHLVPGLRGRIFPVRGQMSAQTPGELFPRQAEKHSWLFNYDRGYDYLTQLPGGQMMFGGGVYIDIHLSGALSAVFGRESWGCVPGRAIQSMWTGSMAFSTDSFPWVGRLPGSVTQRPLPDPTESGSEWVCAAFGGDGMVQAWLSGKAVATMLLLEDGQLADGSSADISWLPDQMLVSEDRVARAEIPRHVTDTRRQSNL